MLNLPFQRKNCVSSPADNRRAVSVEKAHDKIRTKIILSCKDPARRDKFICEKNLFITNVIGINVNSPIYSESFFFFFFLREFHSAYTASLCSQPPGCFYFAVHRLSEEARGKKKRIVRACARNTGFHRVWQMTNAELPRRRGRRGGGGNGHRLKAEPTKSLTTWLGLGQESPVNGSGGIFSVSDICFLLSTLWLLYALYHCPRGVLSRIGRVLIILPPPLRVTRVIFLPAFSARRDLRESFPAPRARILYFRAKRFPSTRFQPAPLESSQKYRGVTTLICCSSVLHNIGSVSIFPYTM